ncbi:MAG: FliM/FliN family flagellar motor switch protein [Desulfurobacteriaceae bacterium]
MEKKKGKFERFKDVNLRISLSIGTKTMSLSKVMRLREGDIIEFDRKVDDYLDVYLNGRKFGIGELIIVNEKYSLRLVDLV